MTRAGRVFRLRGHGMPAVGKPDRARRPVRHGRHRHSVAPVAGGARALRSAAGARRRQEGRVVMNLSSLHGKGAGSRHRRPAAGRARRPSGSLPEHLLLALVAQRDGVVPAVLGKMQIDANVRRAGSPGRSSISCRRCRAARSPALSARLRKVLTTAETEAEALKDEFTSTEHLLPRDCVRVGPLPRRPVAQDSTGSRATRCSRRWPPFADRSASPIRTRKASTRRSSATAAT